MVNDPADLRRTLEKLLEDGDVLARTRRFLKDSDVLAETERPLKSGSRDERSGLGDGQLANWRRRGLPGSFVEGAALYHVGGRCKGLFDPAEEIGMEGDTFCQVFIVHDAENRGEEWLDCTVLQQWGGVRSLEHDGAPSLTHPAYRSSRDAANDEDRPQVGSLVEGDTRFRKDHDGDGTVVVSWEIDREPRDYGYFAHFPKSIRNNHVEAVGGCPSIPVRSAHLLAFLPRRFFDASRGRSPSNPRGIPSVFATLLNGNPVQIMESYLGIRGEDAAKAPPEGGPASGSVPPQRDLGRHFRRLGPWFREGPKVVPGFDSRRFPPSIREHESFDRARKSAQEGGFRAFSAHIEIPRPFLTYFMVFGPPEDPSGAASPPRPPLDGGDSSG